MPASPRVPLPPCEPPRAGRCLPWPAPALLAWLAAWLLLLATRPACTALGLSASWAWIAATALGAAVAAAMQATSRWRRGWVAAGFPLSALASGLAGTLPAWAWLLPLGLLLAAYPLRAWRDAPLFPTPADALAGLARAVALPPGARVLDAGCGLGDGLRALRAAYPQARLEGVEWSRALCAISALRCRWARVRPGDMWAADWSALDLVYLFQRPESMARALAKARAEMAPGSWLVSLDFAVPGVPPTLRLERPGAQRVWAYRIGPAGDAAPGRRSTRASPGR